VRVANSAVVRLGGFMAAVAGVPRVPTRVAQAAGTVIGAARIIEQGCPHLRMSVFASGVNRVGDIKWMILHGAGMAGNPEILRLEGQLQHAQRYLEGLVMAGAAKDYPPASSVVDGVPVGDAHVVPPPAAMPPDATVQLTAPAGAVTLSAPMLKSVPAASLLATPSSQPGARSSRASPSGASYTFTDEELDEILGDPRIDALMGSQGSTSDGRPRRFREALAVGGADPVVGEAPPAGQVPPVGDAPAVGDAPPAWAVETEHSGFGDEDYLVPVEDGRNIDAANAPVNVKPGVGAPPPPALVESQVAPAIIKPSKAVIRHVTKLLALKGRKAQRLRDAFKGMVGVVAAEHKCGLKRIQLCLLPWWPYKVSADPSVVFEPDAMWPLQVVVPERLTLTTKRSRDQETDGEKVITLKALPFATGPIDKLVAAIMLMHDKEALTQRTLANFVFMVQKAEYLSAADAAAEVAARLAAAKAAGVAARAAAAIPATSAPGTVPISPAQAAAEALSLSPFSVALSRPTQSPFHALGNLARGTQPPGNPAGRASPASRRPSSVRRPSAAEVRRTARAAAAQAAASAVVVSAAAAAIGGSGAADAKRRRVGEQTAGRATASAVSDRDGDMGVARSQSGGKLCMTSGSCTLLGPTGVPVAEAEAFFERSVLHGHPVPAYMVVVYVDVVLVPGNINRHERRFPKERPATQDTRMMSELHDSFIVWERTAVVKVGKEVKSD